MFMLLYSMLCLQRPLAQLLTTAWSGGISHGNGAVLYLRCLWVCHNILPMCSTYLGFVLQQGKCQCTHESSLLLVLSLYIRRKRFKIDYQYLPFVSIFQLVSSSNLGRWRAQAQSYAPHLNELMLSLDLFCPDIR
jgi:hypothetical protein